MERDDEPDEFELLQARIERLEAQQAALLQLERAGLEKLTAGVEALTLAMTHVLDELPEAREVLTRDVRGPAPDDPFSQRMLQVAISDERITEARTILRMCLRVDRGDERVL